MRRDIGGSRYTRFRYPRFRISAILFQALRDISDLSAAMIETGMQAQ